MVIDGAQKKIGGAGFRRAIAEIAILIDRHNHDGNVGTRRPTTQLPNEFGAIHGRHLVVGDDEIGRVLIEANQRRSGVGKGVDADMGLERRCEP